MFPRDKKKERFPYQPEGFESEIRRLEDELLSALRNGEPFSYGFSVVSVNGQPVEQRTFDPSNVEDTEPLIDILEEKDHTKVLIDLPGIEKKDIILTAKGNTLEVKVDTEVRKYNKKIELKHSAQDPKAQYRNGVLEIRIKRDEPENVKIG